MNVIKFQDLSTAIDDVVVTDFPQFGGEPDEQLKPDDPELDAKIDRYAAPVRALFEPLVDDLGHITVEQLMRAGQKYKVAVDAIRQAISLSEHPLPEGFDSLL